MYFIKFVYNINAPEIYGEVKNRRKCRKHYQPNTMCLRDTVDKRSRGNEGLDFVQVSLETYQILSKRLQLVIDVIDFLSYRENERNPVKSSVSKVRTN